MFNARAYDVNIFFEAGLAFETDTYQNDCPANKVVPGRDGLFGADVTGWNVIIS